jgi:hypothetical protein
MIPKYHSCAGGMRDVFIVSPNYRLCGNDAIIVSSSRSIAVMHVPKGIFLIASNES